MDKVIEAILALIPFSNWFENLGLSKELSAGLSVLVSAGLLWGLTVVIEYLYNRWKNSKTAEDLKPQFDYQSVENATKIYIPTHYQNASPTRQEEPGFTHQYVSRSPLIPFFIKTAFNEKIDGERFYLILADSGMGKTTFMINLYTKYHSFFNRHRKYKMKLFRFSHPDTLAEIKEIKNEDAIKTILLLDGLDEDPNIVSKDPNVSDAEAFQNRVDEIIEATRNFCEVVMTCRTQYFPGQEDNPYELKVKRPDEKGFYTLNKLYISPFNDQEVKKYLNKKYGYLSIWNRNKKKRALNVVQKSRFLVMRPMLLSYIDYLVEDDRSYDSLSSIYETLIKKWLEREAYKRKHTADREKFIDNLYKVSQQAAVAIYNNWQRKQQMYLTKEEAFEISTQNNIELSPVEITGQSLLTCDGNGNWKFAHKSILEFFLAKELCDDNDLNNNFSFANMDMARIFYSELCEKHILNPYLNIQGLKVTKKYENGCLVSLEIENIEKVNDIDTLLRGAPFFLYEKIISKRNDCIKEVFGFKIVDIKLLRREMKGNEAAFEFFREEMLKYTLSVLHPISEEEKIPVWEKNFAFIGISIFINLHGLDKYRFYDSLSRRLVNFHKNKMNFPKNLSSILDISSIDLITQEILNNMALQLSKSSSFTLYPFK